MRQGVIEPCDLRGQPGDMRLDSLLDPRWRGVQAGALRAHHLDELAPPHQQGPQLLGLGIRQGPGRRLDGLRKVRNDLRVNPVGFGQDPHRLGKSPDVAGIDDHHREGGRHQGRDEWPLVPPGRLKDNQGGGQGTQTGDERVNAWCIVGRTPGLGSRAHGDGEGRFRDINTHKERGRYHRNLLYARPTLQDTGSRGPVNCAGCSRGRRDDPRSSTVSRIRGATVCHARTAH